MINWARIEELFEDFGADGFADVADVFIEEVTESLDRLSAAQDPDSLLLDTQAGGESEPEPERDEFDDLLEGRTPGTVEEEPVSREHDTGPQFGADRFGDEPGGLDLDDDDDDDSTGSSTSEFQQSPEREYFAPRESKRVPAMISLMNGMPC